MDPQNPYYRLTVAFSSGAAIVYYKGKKVDSSRPFWTDFHGYGDKIRSEIAARIPKKRNGLKALDIGTGFGSTVNFLAARLPTGSKIWTVDPSQEMLDKVRDSMFGEGNDARFKAEVEFVQGNAEKLGFDDNFFDFAASVMVLHHLENLEPVCRELYRVLKGGGKIVLTDYMPAAGKELEFHARHLESDFFKPADVKKTLLASGKFSKVNTKSFKLWYLIEAIK
jgi:ubiquinone/menaquinone biosynthesis C-methylase UbiE